MDRPTIAGRVRGFASTRSGCVRIDRGGPGRLYQELAANRFEEKFNGDKLATTPFYDPAGVDRRAASLAASSPKLQALRWAVLEQKHRTVRIHISQVLVVKGENGDKKIISQLASSIPMEYTSLVYDDQSLSYVDSKSWAAEP